MLERLLYETFEDARLGDADALDGGLLRVLADVETVIAGLDRA